MIKEILLHSKLVIIYMYYQKLVSFIVFLNLFFRFNRLYIEAGEFLGTARKQYIKASFYISELQ